MASPAPNALLSIVSDCRNGMNSGVGPTGLLPNQLSFAVNTTNRSGPPQTRPAIRKIPLTYQSSTVQANATQALFQGAGFYQALSGNENCLLASIGGRIFRYLVGSSNVVQDVSIAADLNNPTNPQAWLFQGENFEVINDGVSLPLFWDGADRKSTRLNSSHLGRSRMPSSA